MRTENITVRIAHFAQVELPESFEELCKSFQEDEILNMFNRAYLAEEQALNRAKFRNELAMFIREQRNMR